MKVFIALVTIERQFPEQKNNMILRSDVLGATGYMAIKAKNKSMVGFHLRKELAELSLIPVEISEISEIITVDDITHIDEHLAQNFLEWNKTAMTAWGTLHNYLDE